MRPRCRRKGSGRPALGNDAAFSYQSPLLKRRPQDEHKVDIAYDRAAGVVRWLVNGKERFRVDCLGRRIDERVLTLDHGGEEQDVEPKHLDFGMIRNPGERPDRPGRARAGSPPRPSQRERGVGG